MRKLNLTDVSSVRTAMRVASEATRDQLVVHKLHCVLLVGLGCSCQEVAGWFGDSTRSIERWVGVVNHLGVTGLMRQARGGRTPCLSADNALRLAFELTQSPACCGFPGDCWRGKLLVQHLQTHYGIRMSLRQCQRKLRSLRRQYQP